MLFELGLEVGKPLADLVQHVVELAVLGVLLVEVRLVPDSLLLGHDARVSPAEEQLLGEMKLSLIIDKTLDKEQLCIDYSVAGDQQAGWC